MKCAYWNTKSIKRFDLILEILKQKKPDVFFLSETKKGTLERNKKKLFDIGYEYFANPGCEKVFIIKKIKIHILLDLQHKNYTTIKIQKLDIYIIAIHLPSQMYKHMDALKEFIRDFRLTIDTEIGDSTLKNILVIGDFNVNPYEKPMVDFDGFLASNSINSRKVISQSSKRKSTYYNPTWKLYSEVHFPGTKYFPRPSASSNDIIEFHFLDQVVISRHLLDNLSEQHIEVVEKTKNFEFLCRKKNTIEGSDHLPLIYQFKLN